MHRSQVIIEVYGDETGRGPAESFSLLFQIGTNCWHQVGCACLVQPLIADWLKRSAHSEATNKGNIAPSQPTKVSPGTAPQRQTAWNQNIKSGGSASDKTSFLYSTTFHCFFFLDNSVGRAWLKESHTSWFYLIPKWPKLNRRQPGRERKRGRI